MDDFIVANGIGALREILEKAEEPAPVDAVKMKMTAKVIDPGREVAAILANEKQDGVFKLRFYKGDFYRWMHGEYVGFSASDIRARVVNYLDVNYCKLTSSITNNVMDVLKAKSNLSPRIDPPAWLSAGDKNWPADEMLATKDVLIHLPSFAEKKTAIIPATPRFFTLSALDYAFDGEAAQPATWLEFLKQLWPDAEERDNIDALQEWFGCPQDVLHDRRITARPAQCTFLRHRCKRCVTLARHSASGTYRARFAK